MKPKQPSPQQTGEFYKEKDPGKNPPNRPGFRSCCFNSFLKLKLLLVLYKDPCHFLSRRTVIPFRRLTISRREGWRLVVRINLSYIIGLSWFTHSGVSSFTPRLYPLTFLISLLFCKYYPNKTLLTLSVRGSCRRYFSSLFSWVWMTPWYLLLLNFLISSVRGDEVTSGMCLTY